MGVVQILADSASSQLCSKVHIYMVTQALGFVVRCTYT